MSEPRVSLGLAAWRRLVGPGAALPLPARAGGRVLLVPAGGRPRALPYFYFFPFLTLLLLDRAFRDDARCAANTAPPGRSTARPCPTASSPTFSRAAAARSGACCAAARRLASCCLATPDHDGVLHL